MTYSEATDEGVVVWVAEEPPGRCELCEKVTETRPYGPNGEQVCVECAMADEAAAKRQFEKRCRGEI